MKRKAQCSCGNLSLVVEGEPYATVICHCSACKRRTGSSHGVGVYFEACAVTIDGSATKFDRQVDDRTVSSFFCSVCGTSVYWKTDLHPQGIGIALGAFDDPAAFQPDRSVWETAKLDWLNLGAVPGHTEGGRSERTR